MCKNIIDETLDGDSRMPCVKCGSTNRTFEKQLECKIKCMAGLSLKHKRPGMKKPLLEIINGFEMSIIGKKLVKKFRLIDREHDIYQETITDSITNVIIHDCQEKLTDHTCHGSAKNKLEW